MNFKIELDETLSGNVAKIYTIRNEGDDMTYLEHFVADNIKQYPKEVTNILAKLQVMGHETGCESNLFTHNEGHGGDGVACLKDETKRFRLYCIYFRDTLIICGSGGFKDLSVRTYQEDETLNNAAEAMKTVAAKINESIRRNELEIESDGTIDFYTNDYE